MYKVETWVLKDVIKVLDGINNPSVCNSMRSLINLEKKAAKLSKLIKDNYTEVKI